jgi:nucleotide-binding universal stress UspA family protein
VAGILVDRMRTPLLVGRGPLPEPDGRILVAVDGSTCGRREIETLRDCVALEGREITLMHVVETPWVHLGLDQDWGEFIEEKPDQVEPALDVDRTMRRQGAVIVNRASAGLEGFHADLSTVIVEGIPGDEILSETDTGSYDLVVLGSSGSDDVKHQMLGSVAAKVAWQARCSVLVVR